MKKTDTQLIPSGDQTRIPKPLASSAASAESASEYAPEDSFAEVVRRYGVDEQALARALIMKLLLRVDQLFGKIEEAFAGQALIRRLPPDAPANQKWFNAYTAYCGRASKLLEQAVELVRVLSSMTVRTTDSASPPKKGRLTRGTFDAERRGQNTTAGCAAASALSEIDAGGFYPPYRLRWF